MNKYLKISAFLFFLFLGFHVKSAFAFTCTAVDATENWGVAGSWTSCNSTFPQAGDDVVINMTAGHILTVNVNTGALGSLDMTGNAGTLAGANSLIIRGVAGATRNVIIAGTVTYTGALTFQFVGSTAQINLTTNGNAMTTVTVNTNPGTLQLQDDLNFSSARINIFNIVIGATIDLNAHSIKGNSVAARVLIQSTVMGTQRTITLNGGSFTNADFQDINLSANTNLSAISGGSGDCGGNSNITFTAATTTSVSGSSGWSWSTATWTVRAPLPQDDAVFTNALSSGQNIFIDEPRAGHTIDFSGLTWSGTAPIITITGGVAPSVFGSFKIPANLTTIAGTYNFQGRTATAANGTATAMPAGGWQITSAGNTWGSGLALNTFDGTYQLQDAYANSGAFTFTMGTFDLNSFNFSVTVVTGTGALTRVLNGGTGNTLTLTSTNNVWNFSGATGVTLNITNTILQVTNVSATSKSFFGNGYTYGTVTFSGQNITVLGNNTIATLNLNNATTSVATTIGTLFTGASTTTITSSLTTNGSAGVLVTATSTNGSIWEIKKTGGGTVCTDFLKLARSFANPASTFYAGANSTDAGNNANWTFTACPAGTSVDAIFFDGD